MIPQTLCKSSYYFLSIIQAGNEHFKSSYWFNNFNNNLPLFQLFLLPSFFLVQNLLLFKKEVKKYIKYSNCVFMLISLLVSSNSSLYLLIIMFPSYCLVFRSTFFLDIFSRTYSGSLKGFRRFLPLKVLLLFDFLLRLFFFTLIQIYSVYKSISFLLSYFRHWRSKLNDDDYYNFPALICRD